MSWIEQIRARNARAMLSPLGNAYATHDEYEREISELLKAFDDAKTVGHAVMSNRDYFRKRVRALEGEVANLKAERERYEHATEELTYIIQKAAHRRCDYCILRTEPCPARGLNAECGFEYAGAEEGESELDGVGTAYERMKAERDALMVDLQAAKPCACCKHQNTDSCVLEDCMSACGEFIEGGIWEWRGLEG